MLLFDDIISTYYVIWVLCVSELRADTHSFGIQTTTQAFLVNATICGVECREKWRLSAYYKTEMKWNETRRREIIITIKGRKSIKLNVWDTFLCVLFMRWKDFFFLLRLFRALQLVARMAWINKVILILIQLYH